MKKIYILAGIVLFTVFVIMCWFFFAKFFEFGTNLGGGASDILSDEKDKFIGVWGASDYDSLDPRFVGANGIYIFNSDSSGSIGGLSCNWDIENEKLVVDYNEGFSTLTYTYLFSNENNFLVLTNFNGSIEFIKK